MFGKLFEKRNAAAASTEDSFNWSNFLSDDSNNTSLNENNYFTAINFLANTVAKLPIIVKQVANNGEIEANTHYLYDMLRYKPNDNMNMFEAIKALILMYKHYGTAGLFINKNSKGAVIGLYPVKINSFTIDNVGLIKSIKANKVLVDFTCVNTTGQCFDKDIIILRDNSFDGIYTKATRNYIDETIDTNLRSQSYQNELFSSGLTNKCVVQMVGDIKDEKELVKVQEKFNRLYSNKGRIFTVPAGFNVSALNLSLADSQFAELKTISKKDIAAAIGIPFSILDNGAVTEQENISYLTNTISPIIAQLEQEMDYKLLGLDRKKGYKIRVNINAMLRTSPQIQKDIIIDYVKNGIYTINEARAILGNKNIDGGDIITLPSGQVTLDAIKNGTTSYLTKTNDD